MVAVARPISVANKWWLQHMYLDVYLNPLLPMPRSCPRSTGPERHGTKDREEGVWQEGEEEREEEGRGREVGARVSSPWIRLHWTLSGASLYSSSASLHVVSPPCMLLVAPPSPPLYVCLVLSCKCFVVRSFIVCLISSLYFFGSNFLFLFLFLLLLSFFLALVFFSVVFGQFIYFKFCNRFWFLSLCSHTSFSSIYLVFCCCCRVIWFTFYGFCIL